MPPSFSATDTFSFHVAIFCMYLSFTLKVDACIMSKAEHNGHSLQYAPEILEFLN